MVVVMAFDEQGQAATYEDKISICKAGLQYSGKRGRLQPARYHL